VWEVDWWCLPDAEGRADHTGLPNPAVVAALPVAVVPLYSVDAWNLTCEQRRRRYGGL